MERKLVMIEWVDSCGCSSHWQSSEDLEEIEPMVCKSVGWLLQENSNCVVIAPHNCEDTKQMCGDMTIPTLAITKITALTPKEN